TVRRHLAAFHYVPYTKFCAETGFVSKLAKDKKAREDAEKMKQTSLDGHLKEMPKQAPKLPYSDDNFKELAIRWLVSCDLPLQALENPHFRELIELVARSKDG
ncbi:hypothetical protein SCHPADRAFT_795107, partial [Schizopora paradoxa]